MNELSLNILDIANNSVRAGASFIEIALYADTDKDLLTVIITDNGCGMDAKTLANAVDPFGTSRTTRKAGMGLPLFKMQAEMCGGSFELTSELGKGTCVRAEYMLSHIDRPPLGSLSESIAVLLSGTDAYDILLTYAVNENKYIFNTRNIKAALESEDISDPQTVLYLKEMIEENIQIINGGKNL